MFLALKLFFATETVYLSLTELFEIELFISIKMDLANTLGNGMNATILAPSMAE